MPRLIPDEVRAKAARMLRDGKQVSLISRVCRVSYPWVVGLRCQLGLHGKKTPALRPAQEQVQKGDNVVIPFPTVPAVQVEAVEPLQVRLSDEYVLQTADALDMAENRHLTQETWEKVVACRCALRELVELRRLVQKHEPRQLSE